MKRKVGSFDFVVVGGGIAGTTSVERLLQLSEGSNYSILLITPFDIVKNATVTSKISKAIDDLHVENISYKLLFGNFKNLTVLVDAVRKIDSKNQTVYTTNGEELRFQKLILCTGSVPKNLPFFQNCPFSDRIITIRDTDSVNHLSRKLQSAKTVAVIGNGAIAMELVYSLNKHKIKWIIREKHVGNAFFDAETSNFLMDVMLMRRSDSVTKPYHTKFNLTVIEESKVQKDEKKTAWGSALGPDWGDCHFYEANNKNTACEPIEHFFESEVTGANLNEKNAILLFLSNGTTVECDVVVVSIGVIPNTSVIESDLELGPDLGYKVNKLCVSSSSNILAAGDCCHFTACADCSYTNNLNLWFQRRLWNSARILGLHAAASAYLAMANDSYDASSSVVQIPMKLKIFGHLTHFFGLKVCMLGLYNAQGLDSSKIEILSRVKKGVEFIRVILFENKMVGALTIGDCDLEEMFENLMISQFDLTDIKNNLLSDEIDICDFFD